MNKYLRNSISALVLIASSLVSNPGIDYQEKLSYLNRFDKDYDNVTLENIVNTLDTDGDGVFNQGDLGYENVVAFSKATNDPHKTFNYLSGLYALDNVDFDKFLIHLSEGYDHFGAAAHTLDYEGSQYNYNIAQSYFNDVIPLIYKNQEKFSNPFKQLPQSVDSDSDHLDMFNVNDLVTIIDSTGRLLVDKTIDVASITGMNMMYSLKDFYESLIDTSLTNNKYLDPDTRDIENESQKDAKKELEEIKKGKKKPWYSKLLKLKKTKLVYEGLNSNRPFFSKYGMRDIGSGPEPHSAVDINDADWKVTSAGDGIVMATGFTERAGNYIKLQHGDDYQTVYCHMFEHPSKYFKKGDDVSQGDFLGYMWNTGRKQSKDPNRGKHVHIAVKKKINGKWRYVDPEKHIKFTYTDKVTYPSALPRGGQKGLGFFSRMLRSFK